MKACDEVVSIEMTNWSCILSIFWFLGIYPSSSSDSGHINPIPPFERARLLKYRIVPNLVPIMPNHTLIVTFEKVIVSFGNLVEKHQILKAPDHVTWVAKKDRFYTLIVTGSDAPKNKSKAIVTPEYLHWLVGNIPQNEWQKGEIVKEYQGLLTGFHFGEYRLVFYLFEQPTKDMKFEIRLENSTDVEEPHYFSTKAFAETHNLGNPLAINYCVLDFAEKFDMAEFNPDEHISDPWHEH